MLHYNDGVAFVAKLLQRGYQLSVVPLVQAYGRLVQDVDYAHQLGSYLRGEPYALAFAAGQRCRGPVQRQVLQAHVNEKLEPVAQLAKHVAGHRLAPAR